ncbi:hypothetical protein ACFVR1_07070 [Psychrobacillus sp. NPDC058041]|uniref:hypothetical protein n=1 Tax=Psychrobacillus sp. NPDC058041 TaxID=3346310 RepID=UPI0036D75C95
MKSKILGIFVGIIIVGGIIYAINWSTFALPVVYGDAEEEMVDDINVKLQGLVDNSNGLITEVSVEHTGSYYQVDIYLEENAWKGLDESDKQSFAKTTGAKAQKILPDSTIVDFYSAENGDIVVQGDVFGAYTIVH